MKRACLALTLSCLLSLTSFAHDGHDGHKGGHGGTVDVSKLGNVDFQTSCSAAVKPDFNHAMALLHSFEYDEAGVAFQQIAAKDPNCAMAKWGEAMTHFHGLWGEFEPRSGANAVAAAKQIAAKNRAVTAREKAYIEAIAEIYNQEALAAADKQGSKADARGYSEPAREPQVRYMQKMAELAKAYPQDTEAQIFHALALNVTSPRSDKTHAQLHQCLNILNPILEKMPNHPGVAHYIIHCSDNAEMANLGLTAARKYAKIAPASAHATHMPSHIFAQLGLWDEMVDSNYDSLRAAEEDKNASACQKVGNTLHAVSFLVFGLAESGRSAEAWKMAQHGVGIPASVKGGENCDDNRTLPVSQYVMSTGDWERGKDIKLEGNSGPVVNGMILVSMGISAANSGDDARAATAEKQLAEMRDERAKMPGGSPKNGAEALRLAVAAWRAHSAGDKANAHKLMRESADIQTSLGSGVAAQTSMRELLGRMLLADGENKEAIAEFQQVLKATPNRFHALYGIAAAADAMKDTKLAQQYYTELLRVAKTDERKEVKLAKERMQNLAARLH